MSGKTYLRNKNFFKRDYFEALKFILPAFLYDDDIATTKKAEDPVDLIINSHIDVANDFSSVLDVSAVEGSVYSSLSSFDGVSQYFVKQNNLTKVTTQSFEDDVLFYFNKKFKDFSSVANLELFIDTELIPKTTLNSPNTTTFSSIGDSSAIHNYLIEKLSWLYFLNTSGPDYNPSSYVKEVIVSSLFEGDPFRTNDGIKGLSEYLWKNSSGALYPSSLFASGERSDLSGTQQLDKLNTWNDIIYSPLQSDASDFRVRDKFQTFSDNSIKTTLKIENGPFARLIRALSFFAYDTDSSADDLSTLYDIDECPDELLPLIAQLIGWDLFGKDPIKWRLQLRNAVSIYKSVGTKKSIQSTVNTIFPKGQSPVENRVIELWESYVPYLIYYALATNSEYFKNFETWTPDLATQLNVKGYSTSSLDDNIRMAVDNIILEIIEEFPDQIPLKKFLDEANPVFSYRGRDFPIPPFEEFPYYINCEIGSRQIEFIASRLGCYGCTPDFAQSVSSYITSTAITEDTEVKLGSWLMFKQDYAAPPNFNDLIADPLNNNRFSYADLWCGKSSHFRISFSASEFNFEETGLGVSNTGDAIDFIGKTVFDRAPAHSIPIITLEVPAVDPFDLEDDCLPIVTIDSVDIEVGAGKNIFASGLNFNAYKRDVNTGAQPLTRAATSTSVSNRIRSSTATGNLPRNSARRRSTEKLMAFNGYYDRTGFNMPVTMTMDGSFSGIPLGLVPSSISYAPIENHVQVSGVWAQCEGFNSNNSYFGFNVSDAQNCRGIPSSIIANDDRTVNRNQLPPIYRIIHKLSEQSKFIEASASIVFSSLEIVATPDIAAAGLWIPELEPQELEGYLELLISLLPFHAGSPGETNFINSEIERVRGLLETSYTILVSSLESQLSSLPFTFPESVDNYYTFEFGRDIHRLFDIYTKHYGQHALTPAVRDLDGANIFSHTFGPLLYNHDFSKILSFSAVTQDFTDPIVLSALTDSFTGVNSFAASDTSSMLLDKKRERVCSGILDGVELVLTSGTRDDSSFSVVRVPKSEKQFNLDSFLYDRTFLISRSDSDSGARVRFDISKYGATSEYPISNNFLMPDHEYSLAFNSLVSNDNRNIFGGRSTHVWLHTKPEDGKMWSFTPNGHWVQHSESVSRSELLSEFSHQFTHPTKDRQPQANCSDQLVFPPERSSTVSPSPLAGLKEDDFQTFNFDFNTFNRELHLPRDYQKSYNQLHRKDQQYVVEVLIAPQSQSETYMVLDTVKIENKTMKKLSEYFVTGKFNNVLCKLSYLKRKCLELRIELTKQDILDVFKFFNDISGKNAAVGNASRNKTITETIMGAEGGSRIDYRYLKTLFGPTLTSNTNIIEKITIPS